MRLLALAVLLPLASPGAPISLPSPPPGCLPNSEVATNVAIRLDPAALESVSFGFSLSASPSNAVSVSLGEDLDGDGDLSLEEADVTVGYDCGTWLTAYCETGEVVEEPADISGAMSKTFVVSGGDVRPGWNLAKIVKRGLGDINASVALDGRRLRFYMFVR